MEKKKSTLAKFSDIGRRQGKGPARIYAKGLSSHERRVQKVKEISGNAWWVQAYLMDSCGLTRGVKFLNVKEKK